MATNTYAGESACYRAAKDIEDRIAIRIADGNPHQEAELKGVEEYAIECSILKVAVFPKMYNILLTKAFRYLEEWGSVRKPPWKRRGEMPVSPESMKEQTRLIECSR